MDINEIKYLVFESHLLGLFTQCRSCHQHCIGKIAHHLGSLVCVKQECTHCGTCLDLEQPAFHKRHPSGKYFAVSINFVERLIPCQGITYAEACKHGFHQGEDFL